MVPAPADQSSRPAPARGLRDCQLAGAQYFVKGHETVMDMKKIRLDSIALLAAAAMALSSVSVIANALRLKSVRISG